jgi:Protein of unknown function (DUF2997)
MKEQRITVEIDREGRVSADAEGFTGDLCLKELGRLLDGLSAQRERVERKPDAGMAGLASRSGVHVGRGKKP